MRRPSYAVRLVTVNSISALYCMPKRLRLHILRACGHQIGAATIFSGCNIRTPVLKIGDGSFINHFCIFGDGDITVGRDVFLSYGVILASGDHLMGSSRKRADEEVRRPITIGDGAWLGANVVVLGGVSIARGCVVGAGAIVTRDTEPNGVYVGCPARRISDLDSDTTDPLDAVGP